MRAQQSSRPRHPTERDREPNMCATEEVNAHGSRNGAHPEHLATATISYLFYLKWENLLFGSRQRGLLHVRVGGGEGGLLAR